MTNKINDNVAMMILTGAERVKTFQTPEGYIELNFHKILYINGIDDNFPLCKVNVTYWKKEDYYSIVIHTIKDFMVQYIEHELTAIETVEILGKLFGDDGLTFIMDYDVYRKENKI